MFYYKVVWYENDSKWGNGPYVELIMHPSIFMFRYEEIKLEYEKILHREVKITFYKHIKKFERGKRAEGVEMYVLNGSKIGTIEKS